MNKAIKLVEKFSADNHTVWIYRNVKTSRSIAIDRYQGEFYLGDPDTGYGIGCRTIWYSSLGQAKAKAEELLLNDLPIPDGTQAGVCKQCQHHYTYKTPNWHKYPSNACATWKQEQAIKSNSLRYCSERSDEL